MNKTYIIKCGITPEHIYELQDNEVFVFGSNLQGHHGGGAAAFAMQRFGAKWGVGVGIQGQAYAIPTMHGGVETIRPYVDQFLEYAKANPDKHFFVTKIGCGIAGFKTIQIAPMFLNALEMVNVSLPEEFIYYLDKLHRCVTLPQYLATYGQMRTIVDLVKAINDESAITSPEEANQAVETAIERLHCSGTVSSHIRRSVNAFSELFQFKRGRFDFNHFAHSILNPTWICNSTFETIITTRGLAKLIKIIRLMDRVRCYHSGEALRQDLLDYVFDGMATCHAEYSWLNDSAEFGVDRVASRIECNWDELVTNGQLDNDKLEALFGAFDCEVETKGIERMAQESYHIYCGNILFPDDPTYPKLVKHEGNKYDIWCECRPFSIINTYEWSHLEAFVQSEREYKDFEDKDENGCLRARYYYPQTDDKRPIFEFMPGYDWLGEMIFATSGQRLRALGKLREGKSPR